MHCKSNCSSSSHVIAKSFLQIYDSTYSNMAMQFTDVTWVFLSLTFILYVRVCLFQFIPFSYSEVIFISHIYLNFYSPFLLLLSLLMLLLFKTSVIENLFHFISSSPPLSLAAVFVERKE
jgi:hypothetical protein